jgi:homoserine acetyltransferase
VLEAAGIRTDYVELASPYGHDAFLTEHRLFSPVLASFLDDLAATTPATHGRPADSLRG